MASGSGLLRRFFGSAVSNAAGYAVGGAIQPVLEPLTQDITNEAWTTHPVKPVGAGTAARALAEGVPIPGGAEAEAKRSGVNGDRFDVLVELAKDYPDLPTLLDLWRRTIIGPDDVKHALRRAAMPEEWIEHVLGLKDYLVPPSDLIRMAVREVFDQAKRENLDLDAEFPPEFAKRAALLGISEQTAKDYWAAHWELPSREEGAQMWFRGAIPPEEFPKLLDALDYAPKWRKPLAEISRAIPTMSDTIRFAVREVYNKTQRTKLGIDEEYPDGFTAAAFRHGMSEEDAKDYWAAHWRLPSNTQGYQMLWRDLISPEELDDLIKANDYPKKYRGHLRDIAYHVPGRIDLRRMYAAGLIDRARVVKGYKDLGFDQANAELLADFTVKLAHSTSSARTETVSDLRAEFEAGYITRAEFHDAMVALGYSAKDADDLADLGDARRAAKWRDRIVDAVGRSFVNHDMSEADARDKLGEVHVTGEAADRLVALWRILSTTTRKGLTDAQVVKAHKKNLITTAEAIDALEGNGLSEDDARLRLGIG